MGAIFLKILPVNSVYERSSTSFRII